MHFIPTISDSWYNLPRKGGVAYAAQESWVQNATIRENIIFGLPFDEERYKKGVCVNMLQVTSLNIHFQSYTNVRWNAICSYLILEMKLKSEKGV